MWYGCYTGGKKRSNKEVKKWWNRIEGDLVFKTDEYEQQIKIWTCTIQTHKKTTFCFHKHLEIDCFKVIDFQTETVKKHPFYGGKKSNN